MTGFNLSNIGIAIFFITDFSFSHFSICTRLNVNTNSSVDDKILDHIGLIRRVSLVEQDLLTLPEPLSPSLGFCGVSVAESTVTCQVSYRSLFVLLFLLFCPLHFLTFFDLRRLISRHVGIFKPFFHGIAFLFVFMVKYEANTYCC